MLSSYRNLSISVVDTGKMTYSFLLHVNDKRTSMEAAHTKKLYVFITVKLLRRR